MKLAKIYDLAETRSHSDLTFSESKQKHIAVLPTSGTILQAHEDQYNEVTPEDDLVREKKKKAKTNS